MTRLEQQEEYANLEPVWNGTLEHDGKVPGLSTYEGSSSIFHSASFEHLLREEAGRIPFKPGTFVINDALRLAILDKLIKGVSYRSTARATDVTFNVVRRVARAAGLTADHRLWVPKAGNGRHGAPGRGVPLGR